MKVNMWPITIGEETKLVPHTKAGEALSKPYLYTGFTVDGEGHNIPVKKTQAEITAMEFVSFKEDYKKNVDHEGSAYLENVYNTEERQNLILGMYDQTTTVEMETFIAAVLEEKDRVFTIVDGAQDGDYQVINNIVVTWPVIPEV